MNKAIWQPLEEIVSAYQERGRRPQFWLRDDDAVEPTPALDRLLDLSGRFEVPVALAVIPAHATDTLAQRLADTGQVMVVVHGWSHENHAGPGEKKQELGAHRPAETVLDELTRSLATIQDKFAGRTSPVLVPPWNRIDAGLLPGLAGFGFSAVSAFGEAPQAPLPFVNANVDLIDWHGTRGCRDHSVLIDEIVKQLRPGLTGRAMTPVGILGHHLVHDEAAWDFLEKLFTLTTDDSCCDWRSIGDLVAEAKIRPASPSA